MADFISRQFVSQAIKMGTVAASTPRYAEQLCKLVRLNRAGSVMELGCGTGMLTGEVIKNISPDTLFFAVEANSDFVDQARKYCPGVTIYEDRPVDAQKYLMAKNLDHVDVIVSALPWILFDTILRDKLLKVVDDCLLQGGQFLTVALTHGTHSPSAKLFKKALLKQFSSVSVSATAWRDMELAYFYHCVK